MIICKIPFDATYPIGVAKRTGAIFNKTTKSWVFKSATKAEDVSPKLKAYIVTIKN